METLAARLDALQEIIFSLIEKGSNQLQDHIVYWDAVKTENVLMFGAKKKGISRLGYQPVPSAKTSETKAKNAICMGLLLKSLQDSPYGMEPWSMPEVSWELYTTPPQNCFKKQGQQVEVHFDGLAENAMVYVLWKHIYCQDEIGKWHKTSGELDYWGLYYHCPCYGKQYYVMFEKEANKYGSSKPWAVNVKGHALLSPSSSSDSPDGPACAPYTPTSCTPPEPANTEKASFSFWGPFTPAETSTPKASAPVSPANKRRKRAADTFRTTFESPFGRHSQGPRRPHRQPHRLVSRLGSTSPPPCTPRTHPFVILSGNPNSMKCWRYRCRKWSMLFCSISTTFQWAGFGTGTGTGTGHGSEGVGRIMVTFDSEDQKERFFKKVRIPKHCTWTHGHLAM